MGLGSSVSKAILGDENNEVIKSGTLAVTRGAGVVAAAVIAAAQLEWPFDDLTSQQKLSAALISVAIWAFLAAADALARGYVTAHAHARAVPLPKPLAARLPERPSGDEGGWRVHLIRLHPGEEGVMEFWVAKGNEAFWISTDKVELSA